MSPSLDTTNDNAERRHAVHMEWADLDGQHWDVALTRETISFSGHDKKTSIPADAWAQDIYVAKHGDGYIVRVETFERTIKFMVSNEQAAPLLTQLRPSLQDAQKSDADEKPPAASARPLIWPKVSPLAVWALMCAALTFIPVVGWALAVVTIVLLIQHRRHVRRAATWNHSRTICRVAALLLVAGLAVSTLATWCLLMPIPMDTAGYRVGHGGTGPAPTWGLVAAGCVVILLALTVHEAAHAITAWWLGDGLARSLGRVTLNPLAHIDPFGTVLLPLILVWVNAGVLFGYARPVPVRVETLPRYRRAHILISLAGPGSNLLLAAMSLMMMLALGCLVRVLWPTAVVTAFSTLDFTARVTASGFSLAPAFAAACTILKLSFLINVVLAVFNLIPIPPLDGSWVLEHLFPRQLGQFYAALRPYGFLVFLGAIYVGLFKYLFIPVGMILYPSLILLERATGM